MWLQNKSLQLLRYLFSASWLVISLILECLEKFQPVLKKSNMFYNIGSVKFHINSVQFQFIYRKHAFIFQHVLTNRNKLIKLHPVRMFSKVLEMSKTFKKLLEKSIIFQNILRRSRRFSKGP